MAIYKRGNTWTVRVWIDGRKIERAVGPDRGVAVAVQKELEAEISLNRASGRSKAAYRIMKSRDKKTLAQAFEDYMRLRQVTIKPSTKRTYEENFRAHLLPHFGSTPVCKITKYDIVIFKTNLPQPEALRAPTT